MWEYTEFSYHCSESQFPLFLSSPTTDDVEVRLCTDQRGVDEDIYVNEIEIYVQ